MHPIGEKFPQGVIGSMNSNQGRRLDAEGEDNRKWSNMDGGH